MDVLISNNVCTVTSQKVKDILCMYHIESCTSEPHHQHQNYAKCCIGHIKYVMNSILTFTSIGDISPHQYLYSQTPDISPTLYFHFYKPVYSSDTDSFPAPIEKKGR